ncbi:MAG: hypothetical protein B0D88_05580, partial [Candidatus Sedimenticola endophacoides]
MEPIPAKRPATGNELPFYKPQGREVELFDHAWRHQLPVMIKGPTGCGKTRFIQHMAARLGRPLYQECRYLVQECRYL